jgi:acylphosphatase
MSERAVNIRVYGLVQGVGFRYFTQQQATRLGLGGRATNLADGSVEVVAWGEADAIASLVDWLQKGPKTASVESIEVEELDGRPVSCSWSGFRAY